MRRGLVVVVVGLLGCSQAGPSSVDEKPPVSPTQPQPQAAVDPAPEPMAAPTPDPVADPVPDAKTSPIAVHMTAATLADDCTGPPRGRPPARKKAKPQPNRTQAKGDQPKSKSKSKRRCDPSSIQLSVVASKDAKASDITIKSVELLLESGSSVGMLQARSPSVWSDEDGYVAWDQKIEPAQDLSVSYSLSPPDWSGVKNRWDQSYTVKAVVSIAGADQTLEHSVVVATPTSLPPNVKT